MGVANALRRIINTELLAWAPSHVTIHTNTTSLTDEFLVHRIGLIPFRKLHISCAADVRLELREKGGRVIAGDFKGIAFEPIHPNLHLVDLQEGQELSLHVDFDQNSACTHARYSMYAAVSLVKSRDDLQLLTFETIDPLESGAGVIARACTCLEDMCDSALKQLAHQPSTFPVSRC